MLLDPRWETNAKARAVLNAAADYIEEHGWCQHALQFEGRVCVFGAINAATCGDPGSLDALAPDIIVRLRDTTGTCNIASWNDARHRTKEQVIWALRKAACR